MRQISIAIVLLVAGCRQQAPPAASPPSAPSPIAASPNAPPPAAVAAPPQLDPEKAYHNPVDNKTYVPEGGWKTYSPKEPAKPEPGQVVTLLEIRLLTPEDQMAARVPVNDLTTFIKTAERKTTEVLGKCDKQFQLLAQFTCSPTEQKVDLARQGDVPEELLQTLYDELSALKQLKVKDGEVAFQLSFAVNQTVAEKSESPQATEKKADDSSAKVETNRPDAPEGFRWQELAGIKGSVLVPDNWFFRKTDRGNGQFLYQVTKEDVSQQDKFETGLTINAIQNVKEKSNASPFEYSVFYIDGYRKEAEVLKEPTIDEIGPFRRIICEVRKQLPGFGEKQFHIRVVTMANDTSGTLYVLIFGAPDDEWDAAWKTGKTLFNPIVLRSDQ